MVFLGGSGYFRKFLIIDIKNESLPQTLEAANSQKINFGEENKISAFNLHLFPY